MTQAARTWAEAFATGKDAILSEEDARDLGHWLQSVGRNLVAACDQLKTSPSNRIELVMTKGPKVPWGWVTIERTKV